MIVKIKNRDLWVTPGLYSLASDFNVNKLTDLAATYGLRISPPTLHGKFLVKPDLDKPYSTRYFYRANALNQVQKMPAFIEEIKWLSLENALDQLTLPHISRLTRQTEEHPNIVWTATIDRFKEGNIHKIIVVDDFSDIERSN